MKRISHQVFDAPTPSVQGFKLFGNKTFSCKLVEVHFHVNVSMLWDEEMPHLQRKSSTGASFSECHFLLFSAWPSIFTFASHTRVLASSPQTSQIPPQPMALAKHVLEQKSVRSAQGVLSWTQKQSVKVKDPKSAHSDCSKATEVGKGAHNVP